MSRRKVSRNFCHIDKGRGMNVSSKESVSGWERSYEMYRERGSNSFCIAEPSVKGILWGAVILLSL